MNVLFDFEKSSLYFDNPVSIIDCSSFKDVAQAFEKDLFINIPIRTALINRADGKGEMGIGGGIVWDATAEGEWAEGMLKA